MKLEDIKHEEAKLRSAYSSFLEQLEGFDNHRLYTPMEPDKCNAVQTLAHVNKATLLSLSYALKKLDGTKELTTTRLSNKIKQFLLLRALRSDKKYKAPAAVAEFASDIPIVELRNEVESIFRELYTLKALWSEELLGKAVYRHPIAGPLDLRGFYSFLLEHLLHHRRQVEHFLRKAV